MKISPAFQSNGEVRPSAGCRAFSFAEMLVASAVFLLVVAAVLVGNSFGLRMMELCRPKLAAAGEIRRTVHLLHSEIGSAKIVRIGNGDGFTFTRAGFGELRQGNAIQIYPDQGTNLFIRYFLDPGDRNLKRMTNGAGSASVVASAISSNTPVFTAEDFAGRPLTNDQNNMAIRVRLQYQQMAGSTNTPIGPANYYKAHRVETRTAFRER